MTLTPLIIKGKVFDNSGIDLIGATVILNNITTESIEIRTITDDSGYLIDAFNVGYSVGDSLKITASKEGWGYSEFIFIASSDITHDFTLNEANPSFDYQVQPRFVMRKNIITSFDGKDIKHSNPLPVEIVSSNIGEIDLVNNPSKVYAYDANKLVTSITATLVNGDVYVKAYSYNSDLMVTVESKWVKQ